MPNLIQDTITRYWTSGRKTKLSNGWLTGNAPCCPHNGQSPDKRSRGHLNIGANGEMSYGCFNCNYKAHYTPGSQFPYSFRKLLKWMGADDTEIQLLVFEALKEKEELTRLGKIITPVKEEVKTNFKKHELPTGAQSMLGIVAFYELMPESDRAYPKDMVDVVGYGAGRRLNFQKYDFYWTQDTQYHMNRRLIIPFLWKGDVIGYTSRAIDEGITPKYLMEIDDGYVFNMDKQTDDHQFVLVFEGSIDAMLLDGVAVLHNKVNKQQIALIESLNKEVIVVPDFEKSGSDLVQCAIDQGWSVAFPVWGERTKDAAEAVKQYGKLYTLKSIIDNVERSRLKIKLRWKPYGR